MAKDDIYLNVYGSVVKYLRDQIDLIKTYGYSDNLDFRDIDGHAEDAVLPNKDFILLKDFSGVFDVHLNEWAMLVGISTFEDENMFRHRQIMNEMLKALMPTSVINLYDHTSLKPLRGNLVVTSDTTVNPFSKYNTRAVQFILVGAVSSETTP